MADQPQTNNTNNIDAEEFGTRHQEEARIIAEDIQDPSKRVEQPKEGHDPFPARSSKKAAIRTYHDYAAESLKEGGGSLTKMIIAEREKKREKKRRSVANPKNIVLSFLSIILVVLGIGLVAGAYYLVQSSATDPRNDVVLTPEPLLVYDYRSEAYVSDVNRTRLVREIQEQLASVTIEVGAIKYIYFSTDNTYNAKVLMTTQQFMEGLRAKITGSFSRLLDDNFMYGVFSTTENAPFLILKVTDYSAAYAGMLEWERTMGLDLGALFNAENYDYSRSSFVDVVYYNYDVRAILDIEGDPVLAYAFTNPNTIVIFTNRLTLREILDRAQQNTVKN